MTSNNRAKKARVQGLRYVGDGRQHLTGIPARDLLPADVARLTTKQLDAALVRTDLYRLMPAPGSAEEE